MANSKYAYVRNFELPDPLLPGTFMLFRLDGHSFHRFSDKHEFTKPNDVRALQLMDHAAKDVMEEYPDIVLAFGESDEFSFLLRKSTALYNRRESKIVSTLTSLFTSCYVIVLYPTEKHIRDYFAWRQADSELPRLFILDPYQQPIQHDLWALIQQGGQTTAEAHATLKGTFSKEKHEILFARFGINYNQLDPRFRKGSVLFREEIAADAAEEVPSSSAAAPPEEAGEGQSGAEAVSQPAAPATRYDATDEASGEASPAPASGPMFPKKQKTKKKGKQPMTRIEIAHCDIIKDEFWEAHAGILEE
ncbi:tRNAHis guanylyltransferase-domain-containing protein [Pholiota molesta]|nr:tRNAHis guanylyltransferase-domain-containing protein [Pholiota molesta]